MNIHTLLCTPDFSMDTPDSQYLTPEDSNVYTQSLICVHPELNVETPLYKYRGLSTLRVGVYTYEYWGVHIRDSGCTG